MDTSSWWSSYLAGTLAVVVPALLVFGAVVWVTRRDRVQIRTVEIVVGYGIGLIVGLVTVFIADPQTPFGHAVCNMSVVVVATAIIVVWSTVRTRRWRRDDDAERSAARAAIPIGAREHYTSDSFQEAIAGISEEHPPTPDLASDVIGYWAYRALDSGEYVDGPRLIHYATAIKGWRVSSPTLASEVPWLVAPYLASGDKRWDPAVDRSFRDHALALLTARFGTAVPA